MDDGYARENGFTRDPSINRVLTVHSLGIRPEFKLHVLCSPKILSTCQDAKPQRVSIAKKGFYQLRRLRALARSSQIFENAEPMNR